MCKNDRTCASYRIQMAITLNLTYPNGSHPGLPKVFIVCRSGEAHDLLCGHICCPQTRKSRATARQQRLSPVNKGELIERHAKQTAHPSLTEIESMSVRIAETGDSPKPGKQYHKRQKCFEHQVHFYF